MKVKCEICKKRIDEEGMLWAKDEDIKICTYCYEEEHKKGHWKRVMPLKCSVFDMKEGKDLGYPTVDTRFLFKWSEKILDNYNMTQDRGVRAPLPELLKQLLEEAWVIVKEEA